ncbi:hypothetical protein Ddye_021840 [Dipteronia dyeriana]|uniref:Uncharacterized protein n=1 Tax=Dipteronia dyeriana TaxID=168575 RepID=A0AAD9U3F7_9ROSI|nr:hypothetical protein Ddye_021840 [Dipteronia dyeriana]
MSVRKNGSFDYISVTPLYTQVDYGVLRDQMSKSTLIGKDTFIVVEYPIRTDMLESSGCLVKALSFVSLATDFIYNYLSRDVTTSVGYDYILRQEFPLLVWDD